MPLIKPPRLPRRLSAAHKKDAGLVVVIGGSVGLSGAPRLTALAALHSGAGLVSVAVPRSLRSEVAASSPELMVSGLNETFSGALAFTALSPLLLLTARADAVVVGPGLGASDGARALARELARSVGAPQVLDADALNAKPSPASGPRVATPHPGEAARLLDTTVSEVEGDRPAAARELVRRLGGVVVLKGPRTLVTDGGELHENPTGNPGLAVGGSGDVLAGILAAFLAGGLSPLDAALAAVWIHGATADFLLPTHGERGITPSAVLTALPTLIARCEVPN